MIKHTTKPGKKRFSTEDWLATGLRLVREQPTARITIDVLCEAAGRTRGSFYFHFDNMEAFLAALGAHWMEEFTLKLIRRSEGHPTVREKLDQLNTLAVRLDPRIEQGMRALAAREESVRKVCAKVDEERLSYLAKLYRATGKYSDDDAISLATIEYAAMVGHQQIRPDASHRETAKMYQTFLRLTGRITS